jgi:hypothetical protein
MSWNWDKILNPQDTFGFNFRDNSIKIVIQNLRPVIMLLAHYQILIVREIFRYLFHSEKEYVHVSTPDYKTELL